MLVTFSESTLISENNHYHNMIVVIILSLELMYLFDQKAIYNEILTHYRVGERIKHVLVF